jgi:ABC-type sulfate transport system permease component
VSVGVYDMAAVKAQQRVRALRVCMRVCVRVCVSKCVGAVSLCFARSVAERGAFVWGSSYVLYS